MKPTKSQFQAHQPDTMVTKAATIGSIANQLQSKHVEILATQGRIAGNFRGQAANAEAQAATTGLDRLTADIAATRRLQSALQTGGQGMVDAKKKVDTALLEALEFLVDDQWTVSDLRAGPYTPAQIARRQAVQDKINRVVSEYSAADDRAAGLISAAAGTQADGTAVDWGNVLDTIMSAKGKVKQEIYKWNKNHAEKSEKTKWRPGEGFSTPAEEGEDRPDPNKPKKPVATAMWNVLDKSVVRKDGKTKFEVGELESQADYRLDLLQATANAGLVYEKGKVGFAADAQANMIKTQAGVKASIAGVTAEAKASASVGASANVSARVGKDGVALEAGAFAGAKVGADGSVSFSGVGAGVGAEVSAGIGANGDVEAGFQDGKLELGFNVKAALGVGVGVNANITVDPGEVARSVTNVGKKVLDFANPFD